jgi:FemAB-related protein (PEP-CTERM system-associated)
MKILEFEKSRGKEWDEFVTSSPTGTCHHLSGWGKVLSEVFGFKSTSIMAVDNADKITGLLPMFLMRDVFGKKYLISNPFLNYAGVCAADRETENELVKKAKDIARENNVSYLEIKHLAAEVDDLHTKNLKLNKDTDTIWKGSLKAKTRNQVRKAARAGLTVDFGNKYLDDFYKVYSINLRDLGTPAHPKKLFSNILEELSDNAGIIVVKYQERVIGGMFYLHYKNVFSDPWASSLKEFNKLCPNNMLYWEAIKYACENGFEYFDFGRSTRDSGTFMYKKQWGAEQVQLYYQYFLYKANKVPNHNVNNSRYELAINIWKNLPLSIANTFGPRLVRFLPEL